MSKSLLLMMCILTGLLVLACAKPAETNRNAAPANTSTPAPAGTPTTTASAGDKVGVAECDNFITDYENCVPVKFRSRTCSVANFNHHLAYGWKKLRTIRRRRPTLVEA